MKNKTLPFIEKYPVSILLKIIALNLFSIAGTLKNNGTASVNKNLCTKIYTMFYSKLYKTRNIIDAFKSSIAKKVYLNIK